MEGRVSTGSSRLDAVVSKLRRVKRSGAGFVACCPAHEDREASLSVRLGDDGKVLLHCFVGCDIGSIASGLDMSVSELFADNDNGQRVNGHAKEERTSLTLAEFAAHKKLPVEALAFYGVRDALYYGRRCVEFVYPRRDGTHARTRQRTSLTGGKRFVWKDDGDEVIAYEPDLGQLARAQRYLVIVEGESDTLTLLHMGVPALGIPGADSVKVLQAEHVQGLERVFYVREGDQGGATFAQKLPVRLVEIGFVGGVHELVMPSGAKDPSALYQRDPATFAEAFQALLRDTVTPPHRFDGLWRTVAERKSLTCRPPARRWLLARPDLETHGMANPIGVLPLGKTGMLIAQGGSGKTMALVQLAISVATGRRWFDHFEVATQGRVLLALAEEDDEEVDRRLYEAGLAMRLTDEQRALAGERVVAMGLSGHVTSLVTQDGMRTVETDVLSFFRRKLAEGPFALVVLDTLTRFAGGDSEKDAAQATRFIQAVESLCKGGPTVLVAHHTSKLARGDDAKASSNNSRGSTALTDGARWVGELMRTDDGAKFTVTKSNYAPDAPPVMLVRDSEHGGSLSVESAESTRARIVEREAHTEHMHATIAAAVRALPGLSKNRIRAATKLRRDFVYEAVDELVVSGVLIEGPKNQYRVDPTKGVAHAD